MTDQDTTTPVAVAKACSATTGDDLNGAPVVVAVKLPAAPALTEEVDVESQLPTRPPGAESQPSTQSPVVAVATPVAPEHGAFANLATTAQQQQLQDHQPATIIVENTARQHQLQDHPQTTRIIENDDPEAGKLCGLVLFGTLVVGGVCWLFDATRFITLLCIPLAIVLSCIGGFRDAPEKIALNAQLFALVAAASLSGIAVIFFIFDDGGFGGDDSRPPALFFVSVGLYVVAIVSSILFLWGRALCARTGRKDEGGAD